MKVVFVSNYYNHHQTPFSEAMYHLTGGEYWFVATEKISEERKNMGWGIETLPPFVLQMFDNEAENKKARALINEADVVIFGLSGWKNFRLLTKRLHKGKLTFRYSERIYKSGIPQYKLPIQAVKLWLSGGRYSNMYLLCASAYTAADYARTGTCIGRTYKWGYFPEAKHYNVDALMEKKQGLKHPCASILWAGRLIGWKHPDASIRLAETLKQQGYSFKLSIIGNGSMEQELHRMISEKKLEDCVEMLGAMSPEKVREHMEIADIFLFTSDFNEGWGAVLNESMNSGCAVVASHAVGSVPFLIQNGENGLIYQNGSQEHLEEQVKKLLDDSTFRKKLGENAYQTISTLWNAEVAAKRFAELSEHFLKNEQNVSLYEMGPCSRAKIMSNNWFCL